MCKKECKACKCRRGTPEEIVTGEHTNVDMNDFVDYDDIKYSELIPSTTILFEQITSYEENNN